MEHMKEGDFGTIHTLQQSGVFEYHYYHYLKCALFHQTVMPGRVMATDFLSQINQYSSPQVYFTLKMEDQIALDCWPPNFTKKIQVQQSKGQYRSQEEDASDSESDQEITTEPITKTNTFSPSFTHAFGHQFTSWQREDQQDPS